MDVKLSAIMTRVLIAVILIALSGAIGWRVYNNLYPDPQFGQHPGDDVTVDVVKVTRQSVPLVLRLTGYAETEHSVAVRAQVGGVLKQVRFHEGDQVKAGQLLFVVDPQPYKILVAQAEGQVRQAEAKLEADRANAKRLKGLTGGGYVSAQDYENAAAQVKEDEAAIATSKAKLAEAQLQLDYTRIRAPIDGKSGALAYKSGNLVQTSAATPLVTINQISPILVRFDVPQSQLPAVQRYAGDGTIVVSAVQSDGTPIEADGRLVFIDNSVNQASGTVSLKARFPNVGHRIWPGQLMTVDLALTTQHDVLVVPTIAVQPGQKGNYVYTVHNDKIAVRSVDVEREYQGTSIVQGDIKPGELVVVRVPRTLKDGIAAKAHIVDMNQAIVVTSPVTP